MSDILVRLDDGRAVITIIDRENVYEAALQEYTQQFAERPPRFGSIDLGLLGGSKA